MSLSEKIIEGTERSMKPLFNYLAVNHVREAVMELKDRCALVPAYEDGLTFSDVIRFIDETFGEKLI